MRLRTQSDVWRYGQKIEGERAESMDPGGFEREMERIAAPPDPSLLEIERLEDVEIAHELRITVAAVVAHRLHIGVE